MKKRCLIDMGLIVACAVFVQDSYAQDYTRWSLSEGAISRLGKGGNSPGDRSVVFSPDGTRLAVGSSVGVWLYDVGTGAEADLFTGGGWVTSVSFSPDGTTLATGSRDRTVRLWDVSTGATTANLDGHASRVESVSYSPDVKILASGSVDGTILLWDISPYITPQAEGPDFDGDGAVGFADFVAFASKFGLSQRDAGYEARYDLDEDGAVGFGDFLIFASAFGKEASST